MIGILIIAHAPLATAFSDCLIHIYGRLPIKIGVMDVLPNSDPLKVIEMARLEVDRLMEDQGVLVLDDVFGASPSNAAVELASLPNVRVIAGINVPMLLRAVCYRSESLDIVVEKAIAGGVKGIQLILPTPNIAPKSSNLPHLSKPYATKRNHYRK